MAKVLPLGFTPCVPTACAPYRGRTVPLLLFCLRRLLRSRAGNRICGDAPGGSRSPDHFGKKRRGPAASLRSVSAKGIGTRTQASRTTGRALFTRPCRLWGIHSARTSRLRTHRVPGGPAQQDAPCRVSWRIPRHHEDKHGAGCQLDDGTSNRFQAA